MSSRMVGGRRVVVIAYQGKKDAVLSNPLKYFSDGPQHILMTLCGPRTGLKSCPQGARTVGPDSHCTAGKNTFIML